MGQAVGQRDIVNAHLDEANLSSVRAGSRAAGPLMLVQKGDGPDQGQTQILQPGLGGVE
jgi:hypothetical protein